MNTGDDMAMKDPVTTAVAALQHIRLARSIAEEQAKAWEAKIADFVADLANFASQCNNRGGGDGTTLSVRQENTHVPNTIVVWWGEPYALRLGGTALPTTLRFQPSDNGEVDVVYIKHEGSGHISTVLARLVSTAITTEALREAVAGFLSRSAAEDWPCEAAKKEARKSLGLGPP
jgi:hypothetical protein